MGGHHPSEMVLELSTSRDAVSECAQSVIIFYAERRSLSVRDCRDRTFADTYLKPRMADRTIHSLFRRLTLLICKNRRAAMKQINTALTD